MVELDSLATAAFERDNLRLRGIVQDLLQVQPQVTSWPAPKTNDPQLLAIAAGLVEMLAQRRHQSPPAWAERIGAAPEPCFLLKSAAHLRRTGELCMAEAPEPLRKRHVYAPSNFLEFA